MIGRPGFLVAICFLLCSAQIAGAASRDAMSLHDMVYISPTWGYSVRWYSDEWTFSEESSVDGTDSLWLRDAQGEVVGFDGAAAYGGDASVCLKERMAAIEAIPGATDVVVVSDEANAVQEFWNPRWSWAILLARLPSGGQSVDHVISLDCRTLVPGEAVLTRYLSGPAATFDEHDPRFDVLDAALPRGSWTLDPETGMLAPGPRLHGDESRFPPFNCFGYPQPGQLLIGSGGAELGMTTVVDGAGMTRVVSIENSGDQPLPIDRSRAIHHWRGSAAAPRRVVQQHRWRAAHPGAW
jgi:hypothetical protein